MSQIALFVMATAGLASIIVDSKLFAPIRAILLRRFPNSLGYWSSCYMCCGWWSGLVCGTLSMIDAAWTSVILMAFAGSALAQVFAVGMNAVELAGKR